MSHRGLQTFSSCESPSLYQPGDAPVLCPAGICVGLSPELGVTSGCRWDPQSPAPLHPCAGRSRLSSGAGTAPAPPGSPVQGHRRPLLCFMFLPGPSSSPEPLPQACARGLFLGTKKSLGPAAGKRRLGGQEGAAGWVRGALPACSHRGSFLCPSRGFPERAAPGSAPGAREERGAAPGGAGQGGGGTRGASRAPRASRETPARVPAEATEATGFCPRPLLGAVGGRGCGGRRAGSERGWKGPLGRLSCPAAAGHSWSGCLQNDALCA